MLEMTLLDKEQMVSHKRSTTLSKVAKTSLRNPRLRISLHSCKPYKSAGFVLRHHDTAQSLPNAVYLSFSSILFVSNVCPVRAVHCTVFTGWLLLACRVQIPMYRFWLFLLLIHNSVEPKVKRYCYEDSLSGVSTRNREPLQSIRPAFFSLLISADMALRSTPR